MNCNRSCVIGMPKSDCACPGTGAKNVLTPPMEVTMKLTSVAPPLCPGQLCAPRGRAVWGELLDRLRRDCGAQGVEEISGASHPDGIVTEQPERRVARVAQEPSLRAGVVAVIGFELLPRLATGTRKRLVGWSASRRTHQGSSRSHAGGRLRFSAAGTSGSAFIRSRVRFARCRTAGSALRSRRRSAARWRKPASAGALRSAAHARLDRERKRYLRDQDGTLQGKPDSSRDGGSKYLLSGLLPVCVWQSDARDREEVSPGRAVGDVRVLPAPERRGSVSGGRRRPGRDRRQHRLDDDPPDL